MSDTAIPAHCPHCGAVFRSRLISIGGSVKNLTLSGNKETCPNCGEMANTAEGVFDIADGAISVISSPEITLDMLRAFGSVIRKGYESRAGVDDVASEAEKIDPRFGDLVRNAGKDKRIFLTALLLMAMAIKQCSLNIEIDANELIDQVMRETPSKVIAEDTGAADDKEQ